MRQAKQGRIWHYRRRFFASSPSANLAGTNEEGHWIVVRVVCFTTLLFYQRDDNAEEMVFDNIIGCGSGDRHRIGRGTDRDK